MKTLKGVLSDLEALAKEDKEIILKHFKEWDLDGGGTIEREELADVMYKISPSMSLDDIGKLIDEVDTDGDGVISFDEFAEWLTNPLSRQVVGADGWLADYEYEKLLRPLFSLWDRNGDGTISKNEFEDCMQIVCNSLALCSGTKRRTDVFVRGVLSSWSAADGNKDGRITWEEFLEWQVTLMRSSGVPNTILPKFLEQMAESLAIILDIERLAAEGKDVEPMSKELQKAIETVAVSAQRLYSPKKHSYSTSRDDKDTFDVADCQGVWFQPPPESMTLLVRKCAIELGLMLPAGHNFKSAEGDSHVRARRSSEPMRTVLYRKSSYTRLKVALDEVRIATGYVELVVPEQIVRGNSRRWFAKVVRDYTAYSVKTELNDSAMYFELKRDEHKLRGWTVLKDGELYYKAVAALRPEIRLFALLETGALMDGSLNWAEVEHALTSAVGLGLLKKVNVSEFSNAMREEIMATIGANPSEYPLWGTTIEKAAQAHLEHLQLKPVDIMVRLEKLDMVIVGDDVWEQFLEGKPKPTVDTQADSALAAAGLRIRLSE